MQKSKRKIISKTMEPEHMNEQISLFGLLTRLCKIYIKKGQNDQNEFINQIAVSKLRSECYEIILSKYPLNSDQPNIITDSEIALDREIFSVILGTHVELSALPTYNELHACRALIQKESFFTSSLGLKIVQLFLLLREKKDGQLNDIKRNNDELKAPGIFTLFNNKCNCYPPRTTMYSLAHPRPHFYKGVDDMHELYLKKIESTAKTLSNFNMKLAIKIKTDRHNAQHADDKAAYDKLRSESYIERMALSYEYEQNKEKCFPIKSDGMQDCPIVGKSDGDYNSVIQLQRSLPYPSDDKFPQQNEQRIGSWNWESLYCIGICREKPFLSDCNLSHALQTVSEQMQGRNFVAHNVTLDSFIEDLKSLAVGTQSEAFNYDENYIFHMYPNVTVQGLLPDSIANYVDIFLSCGTCFKRLTIMLKQKNCNLFINGFIYKALCNAVQEYLHVFHQFVLLQKAKRLLELYKNMHNMIIQLIQLTKTLTIDMPVVSSKNVKGAFYLNYVWNEINNSAQADYITLMIFLLKRICYVYYKHLEKWIFYGILDDPSHELFIGFVEHYPNQTKLFYDRAYFVHDELVPGFLTQCAQQILQCGKYTMLLKAFKPNHPLFDLEYPNIELCCSRYDLKKLQQQCNKYTRQATAICPQVSVHEMFNQRATVKQELKKQIKLRSKTYIENFDMLAQQRKLESKEVKRKLYNVLWEQAELAKERKINEKQENVLLDLELKRQNEQMHDIALKREFDNLHKQVSTYGNSTILLSNHTAKFQAVNKEDDNVQGDNVAIGKVSFDEAVVDAVAAATASREDDDSSSEYTDCMSESYTETNDEVYNGDDNCNDHALEVIYVRDKNIVVALPTESTNSNSSSAKVATTDVIELSASDIVNSNNLLPLVMLPLAMNVKMQQQTNDNTFTAGIEHVKIVETQPEQLISCQSDFNLNLMRPSHSVVEMPNASSELQRNRQRMMYSDHLFSEYNRLAADDEIELRRARLKLNLGTDRARNRRKVLESEYDILTGQKSSEISRARSTTISTVATPMSTSSDLGTPHIEQKWEFLNGNKTISPHKSSPNINEHNLMLYSKLMIPDGCSFAATNDIYVRTLEFAQSNFQCKPRWSCMRFAKEHCVDDDDTTTNDLEVASTTVKKTESSTIPTTSSSSSHKQRSKYLNMFDTLWFNQYLQRSITAPLAAHHALVNNEIMRIFLHDLSIYDHFRTLRNYFFMLDGEFSAIVCERLIVPLENGVNPSTLLNYQTLHAILCTALNIGSASTTTTSSMTMTTSIAATHLSFVVGHVPKVYRHKSPDALDALNLCYNVMWPLNLILSAETLEKYTRIFKHLLKVRRMGLVLERIDRQLKTAVKKQGRALHNSPQYRHIQIIRHKLYHFVYTLQNHIAAYAIQPAWKTFKDDLISVTNIEQLYRTHTKYLKRIMFLLLLNRNSEKMYEAIDKTLTIILRFVYVLKSRDFKLPNDHIHFVHERYPRLVYEEFEFEKFITYLNYLGKKAINYGYQQEIDDFLLLINFNDFYKPIQRRVTSNNDENQNSPEEH